jgi:hypothetical protein
MTEPSGSDLPFSLRLLTDRRLFDTVREVSNVLAKAEGTTPSFLLGKPAAIFAIVVMACEWGLNPWMVMRKVYQPSTRSTNYAFMSELIFAILAKSGRFDDLPTPTFEGPWDQVVGQSKEMVGQGGGKYRVPAWDRTLDIKCKCTITFKLKGAEKAQTFTLSLAQAYPMNSVLWAVDPQQQLWYLTLRRGASRHFPHILMGIPETDEGFIEITMPAGFQDSDIEQKPAAIEAPTDQPMDILVRKEREKTGAKIGEVPSQGEAAPGEPIHQRAAAPADQPADDPGAPDDTADEPGDEPGVPDEPGDEPGHPQDDDGPDEAFDEQTGEIVEGSEGDVDPAEEEPLVSDEPILVTFPGKREPQRYTSAFLARAAIDDAFKAKTGNVAWVKQWRRMNATIKDDPFFSAFFND